MRSKTILIALFIASLAVLGAMLWRNAATVAVAPNDVQILVAAQPLRTGTLLRAEDVKWQAWSDAVVAGAILRPSEEDRKVKPDADAQVLATVYGGVAHQRIEADQPIVSGMIVKPGDRGFLAAVLSPGYRATAISVTAVSGAAGLIFPGDHVDVILTQNFKEGDKQGEEPLARRSVGETIVSNLRVLAIDQRLQQVTPDPNDTNAQVARTVTLEVLPKQAEMITVATELGKLSLTLRSVPTDDEPVTANTRVDEAPQSTWADDVSPALRRPGQRVAERTTISIIRIVRGTKVENMDVRD
jgi:pilus assembly protein CpaB